MIEFGYGQSTICQLQPGEERIIGAEGGAGVRCRTSHSAMCCRICSCVCLIRRTKAAADHRRLPVPQFVPLRHWFASNRLTGKSIPKNSFARLPVSTLSSRRGASQQGEWGDQLRHTSSGRSAACPPRSARPPPADRSIVAAGSGYRWLALQLIAATAAINSAERDVERSSGHLPRHCWLRTDQRPVAQMVTPGTEAPVNRRCQCRRVGKACKPLLSATRTVN